MNLVLATLLAQQNKSNGASRIIIFKFDLFSGEGRGSQLQFLLDEALDGGVEAVDLAGPSMAAARPADLAARVHQIHIADLRIEQAHGVAHVVGQSAADVARQLDHEILVPSVLGDQRAEPPAEQLDQPRAHKVALHVDVDALGEAIALRDDVLQRRVFLVAHKCVDLLLGPLPGLERDDRDLARDHGRDVAPSVRPVALLRQRLSPDIGEIECLVPLEQPVVGLEALALVVVHPPPLLEIRPEVRPQVDPPPLHHLVVVGEVFFLLLQAPSVQRRVLPRLWWVQ